MPQQQHLSAPGLEPPTAVPSSPEVDAAIARRDQFALEEKRAKEAKLITMAKILELLTEQGVGRYPYTNADGKRRWLIVDATQKLKDTAAKSQKKEQADREWDEKQREAHGGDQQAQRASDQQDAARAGWEALGERRGERRGGSGDRSTTGTPGGFTGTPDLEPRRAVDSAEPDDPFAGTRAGMGTDTVDQSTTYSGTDTDEPPAREASEARATRRKRGAR